MVGLVNALRSIPYLPPTQRSSIDINGYTGQVNGIDGVLGQGQNMIEEHGLVETHKVDLTGCGGDRHLNPDGFAGNVAAPVIPVMDPRPTWRGRTDGWVTAAIDGNAIDSNTGGHVVTDVTVRDTLKGLNEIQFPTMPGMTGVVQDTGGYVVTDVTVRDTLKGLNENQFRIAATAQQTQEVGGHVVTDYTVRDTLKGLNETQFPTVIGTATESMPTTILSVTDPTVRETLKGLNETQFPTVIGTATESMPPTILSVTDPTVRDTLKGLNEMQSHMAMTSVGNGQESGYVVIDTVPRDTLKGLNELNLQPGMASEDHLGSWISFQGDLRIGARREQYATDVRPGVALYSSDVSGPNIGPSHTTSKQNRGQDELYWVEPSQIVAEVGDTMTRWIGEQTRDTKRQMGPSIPVANFTQDNGVFLATDRMYPLAFPKCRQPDDIDDEWMTIRPDHFRAGVIFGD
jgi:hypothetical protein